ncbi:MAG: hypothetical protein U1E45_04995 [Geminicoccaceae bacterium]
MALRRFSSRLERLSRGFHDTRLEDAIGYDRIAGYFRSSVFEVAGEAFDSKRSFHPTLRDAFGAGEGCWPVSGLLVRA